MDLTASRCKPLCEWQSISTFHKRHGTVVQLCYRHILYENSYRQSCVTVILSVRILIDRVVLPSYSLWEIFVAKYYILTVVTVNSTAFWVVIARSVIKLYRRCWQTCVRLLSRQMKDLNLDIKHPLWRISHK